MNCDPLFFAPSLIKRKNNPKPSNMNMTKGEWKVVPPIRGYEHTVQCGNLAIADVPVQITEGEAEANAHMIALAGNLNQKYDLTKLEALIQNATGLIAWLESYKLNAI